MRTELKKLMKFLANAILNRTAHIAIDALTKDLKKLIIRRELLQNVINARIEPISRYLLEKSFLEMAKHFVKYTMKAVADALEHKAFLEAYKIFKFHCAAFVKTLPKFTKNFFPYAAICEALTLSRTELYQTMSFGLSMTCQVHVILLIHIIGFATMAGTEAYYFYFEPDAYSNMLINAQFHMAQPYHPEPAMFYNIEELSQTLTETSGNVDAATADQAKPNEPDIRYNVFGVGVVFVAVVLFFMGN